ncbi:MAG: outer membrane protein assembly factor BamA [Aureispira sp.]
MIKQIMIQRFLMMVACCASLVWTDALMAQTAADTSAPAPLIDYSTPQTYEIGGIEVAGANYTDPNGIVALSGLDVGKTIRIPSDQISKAIRKLWKQGLFVDVNINIQKVIGDIVFLEIAVQEYPRFARHGYKGIPKGQHDDANAATKRYLQKGRAATPAMKLHATQAIKEIYVEKGFLDVEIEVEEEEDKILKNSVRWIFNIKKGKRIRISEINFYGVNEVKKAKLYAAMKETKRNNLFAIFKPSKFIDKEYENDKKNIVMLYNNLGYRDARVIKDSVYLEEKGKRKRKVMKIDLHVKEGDEYLFGNIVFRGNTTYSDRVLKQVFGIKSGDVYNEELIQTRLNFDRNGRDISTLYMDNGYLFFRAEPIERGVRGDSVDLEIRISEGPVAIIDKVIIRGNDRTHEHVIRRELRTLPGNKFSRSDIIRSQREITALNYFNPENLKINTPVNPQRGTVDIEYIVEERPSDQLELSAGWGGVGRGVIGTLGVTFNNFSLRNMLNPEAWNPLPQGDGQRLSLRVQTNGRFYQSYNFSFTEPWLGGKKPNSFTLSAYHTNFNNGFSEESSAFQRLQITGASIGLGTRLRFPDDFFVYQISLNYQNMDVLRRFDFEIPTGSFHNLALSQTISRNSIDNPIFPKKGSNISLSLKLTLPYSLLDNRGAIDYALMDPAKKFELLEYHKWDFLAEWYGEVAKNLVVKLSVKMGFLGFYDANVGLSPFERYELGGDGISNFQGLQGRDIISLRGYAVDEVSAANDQGAAIYNKMTMELRYLISPNPSATIWVLAFAEGGNAWSQFEDYNPFQLRRSVGMGLRVFLPMFGTLGFDYGVGFDKPDIAPGSSFTDYGAFNIVLGFEPK